MIRIEKENPEEIESRKRILHQLYDSAHTYFGEQTSLGGPGWPWICILPSSGEPLENALLGIDLDGHSLTLYKKELEGEAVKFARDYEKILNLPKQKKEVSLKIK